MTGRMRISSDAPWEMTAGYSRAVRTGSSIFVSGTTAMKNGAVVGEDDPGAQTRRILEIISEALNQAESSLNEVVRLRMFVTGQAHIDPVLAEVNRVFHHIRPTATIVVVTALIDPRLLIEIEVDAVAGSAAAD